MSFESCLSKVIYAKSSFGYSLAIFMSFAIMALVFPVPDEPIIMVDPYLKLLMFSICEQSMEVAVSSRFLYFIFFCRRGLSIRLLGWLFITKYSFARPYSISSVSKSVFSDRYAFICLSLFISCSKAALSIMKSFSIPFSLRLT